MKKIQAINNPSFQQLSTMISQEILKGTQSTRAAATQATGGGMSQSISRKASVHYFRWKYAFKNEPHSVGGKIKRFSDSEELCT